MVIVDIGANIGLTCCHFSELYPNSQILGFELDKENSEVAIKNSNQYSNIRVKNQGVWDKEITLCYSLDDENDAYRIIPLDTKNSDLKAVKLLSMNKALLEFDTIDFLKMDIEGAEVVIFESKDIEWLDKVNSINIEFHLEHPQELDRFELLFKNKGYTIQEKNPHWCSIIGHRN
ncbi:MAG: FkbM family methyltransferase [Halioglobus sp.]|jgi:FkbM family methyltransferase